MVKLEKKHTFVRQSIIRSSKIFSFLNIVLPGPIIPFVAKLPIQRLALAGFALAAKIEQKYNLQHDSQPTEVIDSHNMGSMRDL